MTTKTVQWIVAAVLLGMVVAIVAYRMGARPGPTAGTAQNVVDGGPAAPSSLTVTDLAGRTVTFERPIARIVMIRSRDIYELSLLLGDELADQLIAWGPDIQSADRDAYLEFVKRYPRLESVPVLGSIFEDGVSAEKVLALNPDLVIVENFMTERGYKSIERMKRAGLPLLFLDFSHDPFKDPQRSIALLGQVLGKEQRAKEVNDFVNAELDKVFSRLPRIAGSRPTIYVEAGDRGVNSYGATYGYSESRSLMSWGTVMHQLRCDNIAAEVVPTMAPINPEYLLAANPKVIVITGANWPADGTAMRLGYEADSAKSRELLRAFTTRPGWSDLEAVKSGRVHSLFHGFCMHAIGFAALQQLAKWLYPAQFEDLDPRARLREFHERFMPFAYRGAWMVSLEDNE